MQEGSATVVRDRAIIGVRLGTAAALVGALGLTWAFATMAEAFFSGKPPAAPPVPSVPQLASPVQAAPRTIVKVIHHVGNPPATGGTKPGPPSSPPKAGNPPPPPPPPGCHSTPSKPC
jgi:hypothetical protein